MPVHHGSVAASQHQVRVHDRLAVDAERDVAGERDDFHLLVQRHGLVLLPALVEPRHLGVTNGADGREVGVDDVMVVREAHNGGLHLVALREHEHVGLGAVGLRREEASLGARGTPMRSRLGRLQPADDGRGRPRCGMGRAREGSKREHRR